MHKRRREKENRPVRQGGTERVESFNSEESMTRVGEKEEEEKYQKGGEGWGGEKQEVVEGKEDKEKKQEK